VIAIIGLGNPGTRYVGTRHNVGFAVVEELAEHWNIEWRTQDKFAAETAEYTHGTQRVLLVKPQTFMNNSGHTMQRLMQAERLKPQECWVVVDDIALQPGHVRVRHGGSAGGHNGLKSIIESVGDQFYRFRLGVGEPQGVPLETWVLQKPTAEENTAIARAAEQCQSLLLQALTAGQPVVTSHKG
jgi:PTH1 family peptidyl-tRNA hydrolase